MNESNKYSKTVFVWLLALVIVYGVWEFYVRREVKMDGVYTKCFVTEVISYKGGVRIRIRYTFKGNKYTSVLNYSGESIGVGEQYIIMLLPGSPESIVFENKRVADCLLNVEPPPAGWGKIPICQ